MCLPADLRYERDVVSAALTSIARCRSTNSATVTSVRGWRRSWTRLSSRRQAASASSRASGPGAMFRLSHRCRPVIGSVPAYTRTRNDPQASRLIEPRAAPRGESE